jgi:hypothetical protein
MSSAGLVRATQVMREEEPGLDGLLGPLDLKRGPGCRPTSTLSPAASSRPRSSYNAATSSWRRSPARAGVSDQSQFSRHFKQLVGVTPKRYQTPSRIG